MPASTPALAWRAQRLWPIIGRDVTLRLAAQHAMFVAILTYVRPIDEVDALIPEHVRFLDEHYASGLFIASGWRVPRTGGVILVAGGDRAMVESVLRNDPFHRAGVATFELIEFTPTKMQPGCFGQN